METGNETLLKLGYFPLTTELPPSLSQRVLRHETDTRTIDLDALASHLLTYDHPKTQGPRAQQAIREFLVDEVIAQFRSQGYQTRTYSGEPGTTYHKKNLSITYVDNGKPMLISREKELKTRISRLASVVNDGHDLLIFDPTTPYKKKSGIEERLRVARNIVTSTDDALAHYVLVLTRDRYERNTEFIQRFLETDDSRLVLVHSSTTSQLKELGERLVSLPKARTFLSTGQRPA